MLTVIAAGGDESMAAVEIAAAEVDEFVECGTAFEVPAIVEFEVVEIGGKGRDVLVNRAGHKNEGEEVVDFAETARFGKRLVSVE